MSFKHGPALIILLMLIMVFCGVVVFCLPGFLERKTFPEIFENAGLHEYGIDVRRIGIAGIDLGRVRLGDAQAPWLSIASIQVDYSLAGILAREIKSVTVSGLELEALVQDGRIVIPGLAMTEQADSGPGGDRFLQLPVDIDSLTVRNATLAIVFKGKRLAVPFSLRVKKNSDATTGKSVPVYDCLLELQPRGQLIRIGVKADLTSNMIGIDYAADSLFLDVFSDLLSDIAPFSVVGKAVLHGTAAVQISPLQMIDIDAECKVYGARIASGAFSLRNGTAVAQPETPLHVRVSGSGKNVRVKIKDLAAVTPIAVRIPFIDGSITYATAAIDLNGNLQLEIAGEPQVDGPGKKTTPLRATLDFSGSYNLDTDDWRAEITSSEDSQGRPAQQVNYRSNALDAASDSISLNVAAEGSGPTGNLEYSLQLTGLRVSAGEIDVRAPTVSLTGRTMIEDELNTQVAMNFSDIALATGSMRAHGSVALVGEIASISQETVPKSRPVGFLGAIKFHNGTMEEKESGIHAGNISAEIPVQWPPPVVAAQGDLTIDEIHWQDKNLGPLTAVVRQQGIGIHIQGVHENKLLPGLSFQFKGQTTYGGGGPKASIQFNSAMATDSVEVDLGMLHPGLQGFSLRGGVILAGESWLDRGTLRARVEGGLQNAKLWSIETGLTIDGINTTMTIDDLLELRSRPRQQLRFDHVSLGDFTIENGAIDFQIESKESLLVEKSSLEWAGGSLYSHALRINPGIDTYRVTIFCDRLKLADLLEQFGAAQAEGEGAVSGRVPLVYADGRLIFGDGFLYSTPGEGGTIRMTGAEAIAAGIPKNTPQFAQIDFAMEALKNFSYKWVKLHTITEDDNLVLKMQLDGMPDRTLPFRYDSSIGEFIRVDLKTEQGILQPIRLDVNFRLPLNTLLDYSKGIGQLIDKMK